MIWGSTGYVEHHESSYWGMLKHSCMVLEVVIPGLWGWGNDRFSARGQKMTTLLCCAQWGQWLRGGGGHEGGQSKGQARGSSVIQGKRG